MREGGTAGCKPNIITTPMFKELQKQRRVWRDLNNLLSPGPETRLVFFLFPFFPSTTEWHAAPSLPSSLSAVKPVKHIKAKRDQPSTHGRFYCFVCSPRLLSISSRLVMSINTTLELIWEPDCARVVWVSGGIFIHEIPEKTDWSMNWMLSVFDHTYRLCV